MLSRKSRVLTSLCLLALVPSLSACGAGLVIPESLKAPCESTVGNLSTATNVGQIGQAVVRGDGDLRVCNVKKDAVVAIAESQNRRWFEFWR